MSGNRVMFVCVLGILLGIAIVMLAELAEADTVTVAQDGSGDYKTIQNAIDSTEPGNTVLILGGTYRENVLVSKSLTLSGICTDQTIIDGGGSGSVLRITADMVNVSNLTLVGSGSDWFEAGVELANAHDCRIADCLVTRNANGILLEESEDNSIMDSVILSNSGGGISMSRSNRTLIKGNDIADNNIGIYDYLGQKHVFEDNRLAFNHIGIYLYNSNSDLLSDNMISNNTNGVWLYCLNDPRISGNVLCHNNRALNFYSARNVSIERTYISDSTYLDMHLQSDSHIILRDVSFREWMVRIDDTLSQIWLSHTLCINPCDALGRPLANPELKLTDGIDGTQFEEDALKADEEGHWLRIYEYIIDKEGKHTQISNYSLTVGDGISHQVVEFVANGDVRFGFIFNYAPEVIIVDPTITFEEDTTCRIDLDEYFSDLDEITYSAEDGANVTAFLDERSTLILIPPPNWFGEDRICVTAADTYGSSAQCIYYVQVLDNPDIIFDEDTRYDGLNLRDYVPEGWSSISYEGNEQITIAVDEGTGEVSLVPPMDWYGQEVVTFTVWYNYQSFPIKQLPPDFNGASPMLAPLNKLPVQYHIIKKVANITVLPVNDAPTFESFPQILAAEDDVVGPVALGDYFIDVDSSLEYSVESGSVVATVEDDVLFLRLPSDYFGFTTVDVLASDGEYNITGTLSITISPVNDAPRMRCELPDVVFYEDESYSNCDILDYFYDIDDENATLTFEICSVNISVTRYGATVTFSAPPDWHGTEIVTVIVSDPHNASVEVPLVVNVLDIIDISFEEDTVFEDMYLGDHVPLGWRYIGCQGSPNISVTVDIDTGRVRMEAGPDWFGRENLTFTLWYERQIPLIAKLQKDILQMRPPAVVRDSLTMEVYTLQRIANVTVLPVNDPPILLGLPTLMVEEDSAIQPLNLGDYFVDVDSALEFYIESPDVFAWAEAGTLLIDLPMDYYGAITMRIIAWDGEFMRIGTLNMVVAEVNDPPTCSGLPMVRVEEDGVIPDINLANHFSDVDSILTYVIEATNIEVDLTDGVLSLTPLMDSYGTASVGVTATDGEWSITDTIVVEIIPVNDPPLFVGVPDFAYAEDDIIAEINLSQYFMDVDSELTYSVIEANVPFDINGSILSITPAKDWNGRSRFTILTSDGEYAVVGTIDLEVLPVNDPPMCLGLPKIAMSEDDESRSLDLSLFFWDIDSALGYSLDWSDLDATLEGATLTYTPTSDYYGNASIAINVTDGEYHLALTLEISVSPVNDAPLYLGHPTISVQEDGMIPPLDLSKHFKDVDSELTFSVTSDILDATIENGSLYVRLPLDHHGRANLTVTASDGESDASGLIEIDITSVNDPPYKTDMPSITVEEDSWVPDINLSECFNDVDSDLRFTAVSASVDAAISNDTLVIKLPRDFYGEATIEVSADDGEYKLNGTILIAVASINDPPEFLGFPLMTVDEDGWIEPIDLSSYFTDVDSQLAFNIEPGDIDASITGNMLYLILPEDYAGNAELTVIAHDGGYTSTGQLLITVLQVNDPPNIIQRPELDVAEDTITPEVDLSDYFDDIDSPLSYTVTSSPVATSLSGQLLSIELPPNFNGGLEMRITASDGEYELQNTVCINVVPVNDPPIVLTKLGDIRMEANEDQRAVDVTQLFMDPDGDELIIYVEGGEHVFASFDPNDKILIISTNREWSGETAFTIVATDGEEKTSMTVTLEKSEDLERAGMGASEPLLGQGIPLTPVTIFGFAMIGLVCMAMAAYSFYLRRRMREQPWWDGSTDPTAATNDAN